MKKEIDIIEEYKKERNVEDENRYFLIGIGAMTLAAFLDWELFLWIYKVITASH